MPEAQRLDKTVDKHAGPLLGSKNRPKLAVSPSPGPTARKASFNSGRTSCHWR
jgi:hypothetical protein